MGSGSPDTGGKPPATEPGRSHVAGLGGAERSPGESPPEAAVIGRSVDAIRRTFHGVHIDVLVSGAEAMVTKMRFQERRTVPVHTHPNVQSGYVVSGRMRLRAGDVDATLEPGDCYSLPAGIEHSIEVIEPGEVIDVFVPPREDFL